MQRQIYLVVFLSTIILPIMFIPFFYYNKIIKDWYMQKTNERTIPYLITGLIYFFPWYLLGWYEEKLLLRSFLGVSGVLVLALALLSLKWKISAHMTGTGGIVGLILGLMLLDNIDLRLFFMIAILVAGLTGTARLVLNSHKPWEVYTGFSFGFCVMFITVIMG